MDKCIPLDCNIIAITINNQIKRKLELYYGISSEIFPEMTTRQRIEKVTKYLYKKEYINSNDLILFTAGVLATEPGQTNLLEIHKAKDLLKG